MQKNSRKLNKFRKQVAELLEQFGYECYRKDVPTPKTYAFITCPTPMVDDITMEFDLEYFNKGEAYYYAPYMSIDVSLISDVYQNDPNDSSPLYQKREEFYRLLLSGKEYKHITPEGKEIKVQVDLLDEQKVERNTFRAMRNWKGIQKNDFMWDFIITINCMPLVAVVIEPTTPGKKPLQDALEILQQELKADKALSTYVQFCIVSDGKHTLVGSATDPIENYKPWNSLMGEESTKEDPLMPFLSMLRPDRLINILLNYNRIMGTIQGETTSFLADCHIFFAVEKAISAYRRMKEEENDTQEIGHIRLIEAEENLSQAVFGSQAATCMEILENRLFLPEMLSDDVLVLQLPDETIAEGMFKYYGGKQLLILGPDMSYEYICQMLKKHPESRAIQIATAPLGPTLKRFIGPCLYSPTQIIKPYE